MNNLVSSNPFKTYIGTIRVRNKKPSWFPTRLPITLSPWVSLKKQQNQHNHYGGKKKSPQKKTLPPSLSRKRNSLPTKLSPTPNLQFAVEVFWEDWRHIALPPKGGRFHPPSPPLDGRSKNSGLQVGRWVIWWLGWRWCFEKKNFFHGKLQTLPNPDAPCVLFFWLHLATFYGKCRSCR